ncbi:MAG: glycosyltransferase [Pedobacter sp.]|jgi:glycosyltransferase involved in cell wall biosynthesis|uniref:glycosyltransferase n=1 Tax=Pedobacter sp. TaxID=1411316 RepID=UPI003567B9C4
MWNKLKLLFNPSTADEIKKLNFFDPTKKTILVIDENLPQHDKSSGSKRIFELTKIFKSMGLNVIFFPADGLQISPYDQLLKELEIDLVINEKKQMLKTLQSLLKYIDYAWISRPMLNKSFQKIVKKNKKTKIIFDTVDLHYIRLLRQSENEKDEKLYRRALKFKKLELRLAKNANATITVTELEQQILENEKINHVFTIPNIHELHQAPKEISYEERHGILFIGGYKHEPNIDAVKWLINEIMPIVWRKLENVPVYLLGSYPTDEVLNLSSSLVVVPGYLNDVSDFFYSSRVFVAPLRYGAGMKGKIGQSLEFSLPIVTTTIGAEGMNLIHGENVIIADDVKEFAHQIIELYENQQLWGKIKSNAANSILNYSAEKVKLQLTNLFISLN